MERIIFTFLISALLFILGVIIHRNSNILGIRNIHGNLRAKTLFVRNITYPIMLFGLSGVFVSIASLIFSWQIGFYAIATIGVLLPSSILFLNKRYFKGASTLLFVLIVIFIIMLSVGIHYSERETVVEIYKNRVNINSIYGIAIKGADIKDVLLLDTLPPIKKRINGYARHNILKGHFLLGGWGETKLYLQSLDPPFLVIDVKESYKIVLNSKEKGKIENYYARIKQLNDH